MQTLPKRKSFGGDMLIRSKTYVQDVGQKMKYTNVFTTTVAQQKISEALFSLGLRHVPFTPLIV